ncbi:MAG TPA: amino acid adenylation domain-containing protein [Blastocatellia bacterium]|nr:amino acid adenylation domain-containing protein [Blastocatellia bacterium]
MVPIGRPIANAEAYVLDRWLEPVPVGAAGELYLGGPGIGRGYLRRPELTAERFIPHLFSSEPGARLYRTGDLVRYRPDGNLEFLGRRDDQIKLRGYRIELGEIERVLDQHPKIRGAAVVVREDDPGRKRLVAYLVMEAESAEELKGLRTYLKERLPDYMVPSSVVRLDKMPLTPNGKLDRKALPKPDPERTENGAAEVRAQTPVEERLIEIFREVLKLDRVGIHDNFFELGGDSILSIQIVSKANEAGLGLTPKQLFQHQSIAELAAVAAPGGPGAMTEVERGLASGDVPLTPIQEGFFEGHLHRPEHFNQSIMLEAEPGLEIEALTEVFRLLVKHHDVLRHRFHRAADGWRQVCEAPGHDLSVERVDLSTIDPGRESRTIEELAAGYQRGIDLSAGPLIRVVVFDPGPGRHPRVLIVVHHLVIDGVSWRILLNDLERGYQQAVRGEAIRFGTRTTSYQRWAERLIEEAQSERSKQEAGYWLASAGERPSGIPVDDRGINSEASSRTIVVSLSEEETEGLLQEIPKVYKAQIHEVLLGAAARAVGRWSGDPSVLIEVEGHGREEIFGGVDLTRTMGWFTVCYPVRLEASGENSAEWLRRVKEPIRESGRRGIYYGMLKYLNREPAVREQLRGWSGAEISFNYLGQLDLILSKDSRFKEAKESPGSGRSGKEQRPYLIEINGKVSGGRLRLEWTYSENLHRPETIEALAAAMVAALRAAVTEARSAGERPFTPSDFPLARLDQGRLERLIGTGEDLEDLYGLSPLQKAMLFHTLSGLNSQALLIQLSCTLRGELDLPAFKQAWQRLVERHAILRTGFEQQELEHPVQMVRRNAKLPIEILDWRSIPEPRQASEFESLLAADREREFDLSNPPLMRLRLVRVAEDRYRLIWSHHHLLLDGWSAPLILQEVFSLYEGFRRGEEPSLKERTHYREYIGWLKRQDSEKAEAFWRERLKGFARPIQLWVDRGDRVIREEGFRDRQVKMCEGATARLQAAAKRAHLTINTILQGAWGLLLSRSAGEMDVVFGTTVSGRPADLPGGESIIGPLINTLPVRMKIPAQSSVGAWMSEIQRDQSEYGQYASSSLMEQYSEVPLGTPLYESILIYENYPTAGIEERRELSLEVSEVATPVRTKYPLTIVSGPGSELSISMAYDSKRLDQPTIDRLLSQLTHVIEELVGDPERPVWSVSLLSRTEQAQILARSRGAERNDGDDSLSHWRFELVAGEQSEAVAVVCGEEQLSYGELNLRSDRMAAQLTGLGVGPEVVVGIQLKATPAAAVGLLGVLKAGGSCLWLEEPEESEGWTAELLITESGGDWPLTKRTRTGDRLERQPAAIRLDLDREESRAASGVAGANLALVRSSVGSGGERNAVMLTHAGLRNQLLGMQEAIGLNRGDRVLIKGCRSVEGRIAEMLWPLQAGACLVMAKTSWEPRAWGDLINEEQVTIVSLTPSIYSLLTREGAGDRRSLKRVILSGESLNGTIANGGPGRAEPVLYNLYQVNECSGGVAVGDSGTAASPETAAIERPLPNTGVYLLDRQMEAVATGVIGEVWVDGEGLARGYAEQAELTADRFRPNRYSLRPGARLFRTGDLGRRRPDGRLEILSAGGDQIHGRGRRLEAWMIERALLAYPGIDQAAVIVEANGGGSLHVEAYVGCRDADWPSVERLRSYLRERVPSPIVPARIVRMESLRLSPDGRIDRRELPRSKALEKAEDGGPAGTWSPYEELVRGIWCELFGTATVGRDESFFELGGHSLLATQLTSRVREVLKVELPLRTVFEEPTIEGLGRRIEQAIQRGEREITPPLLGVPRTGGLPLSFAQQRLWFLDQLVPNNPFYNCPGAMRLKGRLNLEALERVINEIVRRHEILRTRFEAVDAVPVQVIDHWEPRSLEVEDLTHHAPAARAAETASILRAEAGTGFDLRRGPLMRVKVLKLEADEHIVVFTMHHIVSDRWSMGVLVREVGALYRAINEGQRSPLPELKIQYADYAQWQRNRWQGEFLERQLRYWRERLVGLAPLELPTDLPRPALANYRGASLGFQLSEELTRNLRSLSRREGRTLFMTLLATFQTLLSRYSGQEDIAVGSPIANRTRSETESLIGFFVNTLVLRTSVGAALSFRKLLAQVGDTCLGAYAHQDLPFEQLVESLQPERDLSHQPLFQAMLVLQNAPAARLEIPGLQLSYLEIPAETSKFDLLLSIEDGADRLICDLNYDCDLFEAATIERLGGHLMIMLEAVVANPESPVSAIEYLTPEERRQILEQWGALPVDYRTEPGLPVLFERQVERTPEAVAVVSEAGRLTYRELDRRANRLAHYLQARGIGPETMVGLCINRSSEMMVGLLGILKAGGAYVPLDPAYPKPHLAFMLEDTQAAIIVTEEQMRSSLPESRSSVVTLDGAGAEIARYPDTRPKTDLQPENPAYVIYTSGSTGRPKGVVIEHRNAAAFIKWAAEEFEARDLDGVLASTSICFDLSVFEIFVTLSRGGKVILAANALSLPLLSARAEVSLVNTVPSAMAELMRMRAIPDGVRIVNLAGETLHRGLAEEIYEHTRVEVVRNLYGPSEDTTYSTFEAVEQGTEVTIGRPVSGSQVYILDERMQLVPIGVAGEIYIAGAGVARGYLNRSPLTAERFAVDPFNREAGGRVYRTGDWGRYKPDGRIEYLGRIDRQVKVRGYRIELEEIERALMEHPAVSQSVVTIREDEPGDKRLVAYLVRQPNYIRGAQASPNGESSIQQVSQWQSVFDQMYDSSAASQESAFDLAGWNSSYTRSAIPDQEMREWLDETVDRILSLRSESVLEIGCGTGLILWRVAPFCRRYCGTDFSRSALDRLHHELGSQPSLSHVELFERAAENFEGFEPESFDTVIVNSVVQYFPGIDYLIEVLEQAVRHVKSGGTILIGDIRSLPLLKAFQTSVQLYQAPAALAAAELRARAQRQLEEEQELLIDPSFFLALKRHLPRIKHVDIRLKEGRHHNELTKYRYEVLIHVSDEPLALADCTWMDWQTASLSLPALEQLLSSKSQEVLAIRRIPNARLTEDRALLEMLAAANGADRVEDLRRGLHSIQEPGIDPAALIDLGRGLNYRVKINWSGSGNDWYFDVIFLRNDAGPGRGMPPVVNPWWANSDGLNGSWNRYANDPLRTESTSSLVSDLRAHARHRLPEYMMPSAWMVLDELPLTPNGKVNRRALPAPEMNRTEVRQQEAAPRTPVEEMLVGIFEEVLRLKRLGVHDNFFEQGGHSLLATQVMSRIRKAFGVEIAVRSIFEDPTAAGLARRVEAARRAGATDDTPPLTKRPRGTVLPLSFAQQRLWFIEQLDPGTALYNCPGAMKLEGRLDLRILESVINEVVRRHEVLRTRIEVVDGVPAQTIDEWEPRRLELFDLTDLTAEERETEAKRIARAEFGTGFDLSKGPLIRVKVLQLKANEYVVLFTMHHIVSDGWSVGVLVKEVCLLYEALSAGHGSPLPELEIQYADYASWQRTWLQGEVLERQLGYWRAQLDGDWPMLELPIDRPRTSRHSGAGARESGTISEELTEKLVGLSRRHGGTLYMTLLGAFQILLSRYSGQHDIVVGTDIANRNRKETEELIGFFVNQLVLRTDLQGDPSFEQLLERVKNVTLNAYAHQDVPFEKLVEELQPRRDLNRSPLFQAKLVLQNAPTARTLRLPGIVLKEIESEEVRARLDLTIFITEIQNRLSMAVVYNRELFEAGTVRRLLEHFGTLLESIAEAPERRVNQLPLMTEAQRLQIVAGLNHAAEDGRFESVLAMIRESVNRCPDAIAVNYQDQFLSYRELNFRSNQLGHYLRRLGVGPEVIVAVCMKRCAEMPMALLGILKAGGIYLPMDPGYPIERLGLMLDDAGVSVIITHEQARASLPAVWVQTIGLDQEWEELSRGAGTEVPAEVAAAGAAYVIYTSGSTGRPKGVVITHGGLANYLKWAAEEYRIAAGEGAPVQSSIGFDLTVTSVYGPLVCGKRVQLLPEEAGLEALAADLSREWAYSLIKITPAHLDVLAEQMKDREVAGRAGVLVIGGEELRDEGLASWRARAPGTRLINEYGPTETVVGCCAYEVKEPGNEGEAAPIGKPITNTRMYVLDGEQEPLPIGARGELYISGAGVARGYLGAPELTAERFRPDPFGSSGGERMYRTGDEGRYLPDGNLTYLGRGDRQVKVRGYRIELGEIEAALRTHPDVKQSVVMVNEDGPGRKRLVGYVVSGGRATAAELKHHLRERIPDYMVPEAVLFLDEMPVTANGKIDRKRLSQIEIEVRSEEQEPAGSRTAIEEIVAGIFAEVLGLERGRPDDNFFENGGHSLLATQVVSRVKSAFSVELNVRAIFEEPTVAGLAHRIEAAIRGGERQDAPPLIRAPREGALLLSYAQQSLWFIEQLELGQAIYNSPTAVKLEGRLKLEILEAVINEIVKRHELLRTRIEAEAGTPKPVIDEWQPQRLEVVDLTDLTAEARTAEALRFAGLEAETGFDLSRGPLMRVKLLKLEEEQHVLLCTMHHIVSDAWSMGILVKEVCALYEAMSEGRTSPLPELEIQYADYAFWQRNFLTDAVIREHLSYWKQQLGGQLPVLRLPADHPRPPVPSYRGATIYLPVPAELQRPLQDLSRREGVTLFMLLLAAFKVLLHKYTAQEDIIVGTSAANRNRAELEPLIGYFVNMLPLRTNLGGDPRFGELLKRVREVALGGYAHHELPFEKLVEEIQPERAVRQMPLFNVAFGVQNAPRAELRLPDLKLSPVLAADAGARFDLALWVTEGPEGMQISWIYSRDLFKEVTVKRMHDHFMNLLFGIVDRPDARLTTLDLTPGAETGPTAEASSRETDFDPQGPRTINRRGIKISGR